MHGDLEALLGTARRSGNDYSWPARDAERIIQGLAALGQVILGVELWAWDSPDSGPRVLGWSTYTTDDAGSWGAKVEYSARQAIDTILGYTEDQDLWVNIQFIPNRPQEHPPFPSALTLDDQQAYRAMLCFVRYYHNLGDSIDIFLMLEAMELVGERATSDPGTWYDWERCVTKVLEEDSADC